MIYNEPCIKAINFDLDTKKLKEQFGKNYHNKYHKIEKDLEKLDFEHRQGSGYVSKKELTDQQVEKTIKTLTKQNPWLADCSKTVDITNVGQKYSVLDVIQQTAKNINTKNKPKNKQDIIQEKKDRLFRSTGRTFDELKKKKDVNKKDDKGDNADREHER